MQRRVNKSDKKVIPLIDWEEKSEEEEEIYKNNQQKSILLSNKGPIISSTPTQASEYGQYPSINQRRRMLKPQASEPLINLNNAPDPISTSPYSTPK